jgi:AraC-like DNA-binding protein
MSYLARCRILRAAQMLGTEQLSVAEAMHQVGYQSESSFSKAFVRWLGCTPAAYRNSTRAKVPGPPGVIDAAGVSMGRR